MTTNCFIILMIKLESYMAINNNNNKNITASYNREIDSMRIYSMPILLWVGILSWWNLKIVILSWNFLWILGRHVEFEKYPGISLILQLAKENFYQTNIRWNKFQFLHLYSPCYLQSKHRTSFVNNMTSSASKYKNEQISY